MYRYCVYIRIYNIYIYIYMIILQYVKVTRNSWYKVELRILLYHLYLPPGFPSEMTGSSIYPCERHIIFFGSPRSRFRNIQTNKSGQMAYLEGAVNTRRNIGKLSIERKSANKG